MDCCDFLCCSCGDINDRELTDSCQWRAEQQLLNRLHAIHANVLLLRGLVSDPTSKRKPRIA